MRAKAGMVAMVIGAGLALSACSSDPKLMHLRATNGPDEFGILPPKPLEMPQSLVELPAPTPGGSNRTDPTPTSDAIVALGGRPQATGGIPASDGALYAYAARQGVAQDIRATLAAEDLEWRRDHRGKVLDQLFGNTTYYQAYSRMALDQYADLARWRRLGVHTPSAPPESVMMEEKK